MEGKRPGVVLYLHDVQPILSQLTDADAGKLFRAVFKYADTGDLPSFDGAYTRSYGGTENVETNTTAEKRKGPAGRDRQAHGGTWLV